MEEIDSGSHSDVLSDNRPLIRELKMTDRRIIFDGTHSSRRIFTTTPSKIDEDFEGYKLDHDLSIIPKSLLAQPSEVETSRMGIQPANHFEALACSNALFRSPFEISAQFVDEDRIVRDLSTNVNLYFMKVVSQCF
jgi:hypothetical protein